MTWPIWLASGGAVAFWLLVVGLFLYGSSRAAWLVRLPADGPHPLPALTIVVPARDEETTVEAAMRTLLALDYPRLEIIAVDDRSEDSTGAILDRLARENTRLRVAHIRTLPAGWLGKNHALQQGAEHASGDWILFTDADVHFAPQALRKAVRYAQDHALDHLVVYPEVELHGFWETLFVAFFGVVFTFRFRPWAASNPHSRDYIGVGAFNLVRAETYRRMGGHAALAMDVADDIKLGKRMKEAGGRAECIMGVGEVRVRWVVGLRGAVHGLTKNLFAGVSYRPLSALVSCLGLVYIGAWPLVGLFVGPPGPRALCALTLACMAASARISGPAPGITSLYGLAFPLGSLIFVYAFARSVFFTYRQGGVIWRDTFYSLDELRRGIV